MQGVDLIPPPPRTHPLLTAAGWALALGTLWLVGTPPWVVGAYALDVAMTIAVVSVLAVLITSPLLGAVVIVQVGRWVFDE